MIVLALFVFCSIAGLANRLDPAHRAAFERKHAAWIVKNFPNGGRK